MTVGRILALCTLVPLSWSCTSDATQLRLTVEADDGVRMMATSLEVKVGGTAAGDGDAVWTDEHVFGVDEALSFPLDITFSPRGSQRQRSFRILVSPRDTDERVLTTISLDGRFSENETTEVTVRLSDCCVGLDVCVDEDLRIREEEGPVVATCADVPPPRDPPTRAPELRYPQNGFATGSVNDPGALRPRVSWDAVPLATRYEVQMTDECGREGHADCAFGAPTTIETPETSARPPTPLQVPTSAPVGLRYAWRVRGCNVQGCGPWSEARYLDVGRQRQDVDGDGLADLVVGAPAHDLMGTMDVGAVFVWRGSASGVGEMPSAANTGPGDPAGTSFGAAVAVGDLDADGQAEVLVGAPNETVDGAPNAGRVYVFEWTGDGLEQVATLVSEPARAGALFGSSLAVIPDLDGDGYADVAVGAPGDADTTGGAVYIYRGSDAGVMVVATDALVAAARDFGAKLTSVGDVNGDGLGDLLVSAPGREDPDARGRIFFWLGRAGALAAEPDAVFANAEGRSGDMLGASVGSGDLDGDGFTDVAVGARSLNSARGVVYVYSGSRDGPVSGAMAVLHNPQSRIGGEFGAAVAAMNDVDGDGMKELMIGARANADRDVLEAGVVYVFRAAGRGMEMIDEVVPASPQSAAHFGRGVAPVGDVDGDGFTELLVAAPGWDADAPDEGRLFLFRGGEEGLDVERALEIGSPSAGSSGFGVLP